MADSKVLTLFVYDISDDRTRQRIAGILDDRLTRVQESVFEGWMQPKEAQALGERLAAALEPQDSLRLYCVPETQVTQCRSFGALPIMAPQDYWLL